jgi:hypothetical protein
MNSGSAVSPYQWIAHELNAMKGVARKESGERHRNGGRV